MSSEATQPGVVASDLVRPLPTQRDLPRRQRVARWTVPMCFGVVAVAAIVLTLPLFATSSGRFDHRYPTQPSTGLITFGAPIPPAPASNLIPLGIKVTSLPLLVQAMPPNVVTRSANTYTLHQPVLVAAGGVLDLTGPGELVLSPGSYLEVGPGGTARLADLTIRAAASATQRGFLLDVAGRLQVVDDRLETLGRLATLAEGLTFEAASRGSAVVGTHIAGSTTGVYVTASSGVRIVDDTIVGSQLDGIELHGDVRGIVVTHDSVATSGVHDVELTATVSDVLLADDQLGAAVANGVVLYNNATHNTIRDDVISGTFDGIELSYAGHNHVLDNVVNGVQRFCIRVTGGAAVDNVLLGNQLEGCLVGVYAALGATGNRVLATTFANDAENVRIRRTAAGNLVLPRPTNSELRSV